MNNNQTSVPKIFQARHWFFKRWFFQFPGYKKMGPFDSPKEAAYKAFMVGTS